MKYLKEFNTENEYLAYRNRSDYLKPNVSLSDDKGSVYYNYTPQPIVYEYVDLGLPSGTKWATCNVGASKPSEAGRYFQWGDTQGYTADQVGTGEGKKKFASNGTDYKWFKDRSYPSFSKYLTAGAKLGLEDDAANANKGGNWHIPTPTQIQELLNAANTTSTWTTQDNVNGRLFTSVKDPSKSIFIPVTGYAKDGSFNLRETDGLIWSSMLSTGDVYAGQCLGFNSSSAVLAQIDRYDGLPVRGVIGEIK